MRVLVVHEFIPDDVRSGRVKGDLRFIMIARDEISMISPVTTIKDDGHYYNGNPYLVYGEACAEFTGLDKFDLNITVAECRSGDLEGWS